MQAAQNAQAQPDWLTSGFADATPPQPMQKVVPPLPASTPSFDMPASTPSMMSEFAQPTPEADIPDFLRAAGWGESTGTFDESKMSFADEPAAAPAPASASDALPIEQGDMPDWLKAMAPPQVTQPVQPAEEEALPDWINKIGTGALSTAVASSDEFDWLNPTEESSQPQVQASNDQPDWFAGPGDESASTPAAPVDDQPDWMKQFDQPASQTPTSNDQPDWFAGLGNESASTPAAPADDQPDWMKQFGNQSEEPALPTSSATSGNEFDFLDELITPTSQPSPAMPAPADTANLGVSEQEQDDSFAWLENLAAKQGASEGLLTKPEDRLEEEPDWVKQAKGENVPAQSFDQVQDEPAANVEELVATKDLLAKPEDHKDKEPDWVAKIKASSQPPVPEPQQPAANVEDPGKSQSDIDDSLAWLENLAAKQGATEGLLVKPEDRMDKEPDWVSQVKGVPPVLAQPVASVEDLGKSKQERDDSFAWLENLAAKQGATEGLLTKPEDRLEVEPEWVQQAKKSTGELPSLPSTQQSEIQPAANIEDLGKSQSDIDDSLAWLENLAAKQGATEGLLIEPEDRMDKEPDWVSQVKSAPAQPTSAQPPAQQPAAQEQQPAANVEDLGKSQSEIDDSLAWLENLAAKQGATEGLLIKPEDRMDKEPDWVSQVKSAPQPVEQTQPPAQLPIEQPIASEQYSSSADDTAAWLRSLDEDESKSEPEPANDETAMWFKKLDEPEPVPTPQVEQQADDLPAWLKGIEEEQAPVAESVAPASEAPVESDWMNAIEEHPSAPEPVSSDETGEVMAEPTKIEPTRPTDWHPVEEKQPEPQAPAPQPVMGEPPEPMPVALAQEMPTPAPVKGATPKPAEVKPVTPPTPYREPLTQRGTGMLTMPIDPILGAARIELSRSNIPGALETYAKLIKKGRLLDEVIFDLREALNRYPVEINILQSLGDAYMRANRLQDALDAYTKAEELLR